MAHFGNRPNRTTDREKKFSSLRQENKLLATTDKDKANSSASQLAETFHHIHDSFLKTFSMLKFTNFLQTFYLYHNPQNLFHLIYQHL